MTPNKELSSLENTDGHELTRGQRGGFMENCYCLSSRSVFCPPHPPGMSVGTLGERWYKRVSLRQHTIH